MILPNPRPDVSVVVPAHNEAENLPILISEIVTALYPTGYRYEIVVIDDYSTDATPRVLRSLAEAYPCLVVRRGLRQGGQSAALAAGFDSARGEFIVTLDADLQNDPADIPKLLAHLENADLAAGWRQDRKDTLAKRLISRVANRIRRWVIGDGLRDTGCSSKAFRRECIERIPRFNGMHRFFGALVRMNGFRVVEVPVHHRARRHGKTHYHLFNRSVGPIMDLWAVRWLQNRTLRYEVEEAPALVRQ